MLAFLQITEPTYNPNERKSMFELNAQIIDGGTLEQLKEHFFQEGKRTPLAFTVLLHGITEKPQECLIMLHVLTRVGKGTEQWEFVGLYFNNSMQLCRAEGEYNTTTRQGVIELQGPPNQEEPEG